MNTAKAVLGIILIVLSFVGFGLTYDVYVVLNDWNNLSPITELHDIGSRLSVILPVLLGIFSVMFMLIGINLLGEQLPPPTIPSNTFTKRAHKRFFSGMKTYRQLSFHLQ
jgi:hypothetical protein